MRTTVIAVAALLGAALLAPDGAEAGVPSMVPFKGRAAFRTNRAGVARNQFLLDAYVVPTAALRAHDPAAHRFSLRVGGREVVSLEPGVDADSLQLQRNGKWRHRSKRADGSRISILLDPVTGRVKIAVRRTDLGSLRDTPPSGVPIELEVGGDFVSAVVSFARNGNGSRWPYLLATGGGVPQGVGELPPNTQPAPGAQVSYRRIHRGLTGGDPQATGQVIRDPAAWTAAWNKVLGTTGGIPPAIDFTQELVLVVHLGASPRFATTATTASGITVVEVVDSEQERTVAWSEVRNQVFIAPAVRLPAGSTWTPPPPRPYDIVAVPATSLPITFVERF